MRLLVTGGAGFVGSNFIRYVLEHYGPEMITSVDALTTGRLASLEGIAATYGERYEFLHADVADPDRIEAVLAKHQYFAVVHLAGRASGVAGTTAILARARRHGVRRFLLVSGEHDQEALAPAEAAVLGAHGEHAQEVVITRATECYGPFQPPTALIPGVIARALRDQAVPLAGDGSQLRDWLHVGDHCAGIFTALLDGAPGKIYRLASGHAQRDIDLAQRILEHLGKSRDLLEFAPDAEGMRSVAAPTSEGEGVRSPAPIPAPEPLAWKPRHHLEPGLRETIDWYVRNRDWWEPLPVG